MRHATHIRRSLAIPSALLVVLLARAPAQIVFEPPVTQQLSHLTQGVISADINADGHVDLVTLPRFEFAFTPPHVSVLMGLGDGTFDRPVVTTLPTTDSGRGCAALINGDAFPDLALGFSTVGKNGITLLYGNGDGTFTIGPQVELASGFVGGAVTDIVASDLNGDGLLDFVICESGAFSVFAARIDTFIATGGGKFALRLGSFLPPGAAEAAVGDVNGDGRPDVVVCHGDSSKLSVLLGNGDGTFGAAATQTIGGHPADILLQDFDGDGALDLAMADPADNQVLVMRGDGAAHFTALEAVSVNGAPSWLSAGQLDGDGHADLLVSDSDSGEVTVLRGAGDGTLSAVATVSHIPNAAGSALADFDEDGVVDAAVATQTINTPGTIAVLSNHTYAAGSPFTDLGHALAGSNGYPIQLADGDLQPLSTVMFRLANALPAGNAALILGFNQANLPFKGGTMVPSFDVFLYPLPIAPDGTTAVGGPWPAGVPSGFTFYVQYFFKDHDAPTSEGGSNAVRIIAP